MPKGPLHTKLGCLQGHPAVEIQFHWKREAKQDLARRTIDDTRHGASYCKTNIEHFMACDFQIDDIY